MTRLLAPRCQLCGGPAPISQYCAICSAFIKHIAPTVVWLHEHAGEDGPTMAAEEESAWFGDPNVPHEPSAKPTGYGWRPVCSCGFRAPLTHDTEDGALRAARNHAAVSVPRPDGRYTVELDGDAVAVCCTQHPAEPLARFPGGLDGREAELSDVVHEHDRRFHEDDRRD